MKRIFAASALAALVASAIAGHGFAKDNDGGKDKKGSENPVVVISTSMGDMEVELYADKAPLSVQNFLWYVDHKFYDGLIFHRVIPNFMIQGGGFTPDMKKKSGNPPIDNEAGNGLSNDKYTLAMARTNAVHSATSQFFINNKDNAFLNHKDNTARGFGYCVFGKVITGNEIVDKISAVECGNVGGYQNVPLEPVVMKRVYRRDAKSKH